MSTLKADTIRDYFRSEAMIEFHEEHSTGEYPWSAVLDGSQRIVATPFDRSVFYVVKGENGMFSAAFTQDPLHVIDSESESLEKIGDYEDAASAFGAMLVHAGLEPDPAPSI